MKFCILMGSPRREGNTAALLRPFLEECAAMEVETETIWLYDKKIDPCLGCGTCQDRLKELGCVQEDDFEEIFRSMAACDALIFATPIYSWYCTPPMKALMDRAVYAGVKNYGRERGPKLLEGRRAAALTTCGYPPERGADLWEEGVRRWCRHGNVEYLGILCRRDWGGTEPFLNEDREQAARDFAQAIRMAIRAEEL